MSISKIDRRARRHKRHQRVRRKVSGTAERPRMAVAVSNRTIQVQFIDDTAGTTLAAARLGRGEKFNVETARAVGVQAAELAKAKGIERVVVDRGGNRFTGRVRALVEAALEAGLTNRTDAAPAAAAEEAS